MTLFKTYYVCSHYLGNAGENEVQIYEGFYIVIGPKKVGYLFSW